MRLRRVQGDGGASAVEYALLLAAVATILVPIMFALSGIIRDVLQDSCENTARQNGISPSQIASDVAEC